MLNISARKEYFRYEHTFCVLRYRDKCEFTKIVFADLSRGTILNGNSWVCFM